MDNKNTRPPIVSILGHVDHGKTTLLDAIRKSNVAAREHGGITQHIGAYQIEANGHPITFVDTPGHAAFEKMRSRGAEVADIVILVVAAGDGVKPQTIEAIKHIQKAQKPTIVAITKVDLPNINLDKVKKELQTAGITIEEYGGDSPLVQVAAPKGQGIAELLEVIGLVWQLNPEKSQSEAPLEAVVVESKFDKSRGALVTVIVKKGTLTAGQKIVVDSETITVKALIDDNGKNVKVASPGQPVEILGFKKPLDVGSIVSETITKPQESSRPPSYADIIAKAQSAKDKFKVIVKADVVGSLEAVLSNLPANILVLASSVGEVNESDIAFAKVASAPIITFNSKVNPKVKTQAEREGVIIRNYNIIYELLDDLEDVVLGFQAAKAEAKIKGRAKVVATFDIEGSPREAGKKIAGCVVTFGKLKVGDEVYLKDKNENISKIVSIKRFKKDLETVSNGQDCGILFSPALDFKEGDIIESLG
ncbi:translation initiation factor IF-2 [Candidatus Curtissbacteria bacterium]|nr:translation initiation factor IF-2 [Candidatus Curtissbacteria bacterium]